LKIYREEISDLKRKLDQFQSQTSSVALPELSPLKSNTKRRKTWDQATSLSPVKDKVRSDELVRFKQIEDSYNRLVQFMKDFSNDESSLGSHPEEAQPFMKKLECLKTNLSSLQTVVCELQEQNQFLNMEYLSHDQDPREIVETSVQTESVFVSDIIEDEIDRLSAKLVFHAITSALQETWAEATSDFAELKDLYRESLETRKALELQMSELSNATELVAHDSAVSCLSKLYVTIQDSAPNQNCDSSQMADAIACHFKALSQNLMELNERIETVESLHQQIQEEKYKIQNELEIATAEISSLQKDLKLLTEENAHLAQNNENLKFQEETETQLVSKLNRYRSCVSSMLVDLISIRKVHYELKTEFTYQLNSITEAFCHNQTQLEQMVSKMTEENSLLIHRRVELEEIVTELKCDMQSSQTQLEEMKQKNLGLEEKNSIALLQNSEIREKLHDLSIAHEQLQSRNLDLEDRWNAQVEQLNAKEIEHGRSLADLAVLRNQFEDHQQIYERLLMESEKMQARNQLLQEEVLSLKHEISDKNIQQLKSNNQMEIAKNLITSFNVKFHSILSKFEILSSRFETYRSLSMSSKAVSKDLIMKQAMVDELQQDLDILKERLDAVNGDLESEKAGKLSLASQIEHLEQVLFIYAGKNVAECPTKRSGGSGERKR
jgi:chromosome segregation ATPase